MLIVSWNVAGLKPALNKIVSDYAPASQPSKKDGGGGGPHAAISNYLALHGSPAILCLQEHKIPHAQLSSRSEPHRCSSVPGYESFWSCASLPGCKGFNGVVTYVKEGLVSAASSTPLGDPDLDGQGRCVMTDHGRFVVFNVYVPMHRDREALVRKMRVLRALEAAMDRQRALGKRVILVGDMNLKVDRRDVVRCARVVEVDRILAEAGGENGEGGPPSFPRWKRDVVKNWDRIVSALDTIEAVPRKTTNPTTKETFDRFRARVRTGVEDGSGGNGGGPYVSLGQHEDTPEECLACYSLSEVTYDDPAAGEGVVIRRKNALSVDVLAELMNKVCNARWDAGTVREVGDSDDAGLNGACPAHRWMRGLLDGDGAGKAEGDEGGKKMVDVFRSFYPTAEGRFTCWHQMKGLRYSNEGTRIDYALVDECLMGMVEPRDGQVLRCGPRRDGGGGKDNGGIDKDKGNVTGRTDLDPLGDAASLSATTASGLFEGGGYGGGGIATATRRALDSQFLGGPHTGIVYTPPSYSDHVAISLLMKDGFEGEYCRTIADGAGLALGTDPETKRAQPHKKQRSIASFFGSGGAKASNNAGEKKRKQPTASKGADPKKDKKSIHSFFGKQNAGGKK